MQILILVDFWFLFWENAIHVPHTYLPERETNAMRAFIAGQSMMTPYSQIQCSFRKSNQLVQVMLSLERTFHWTSLVTDVFDFELRHQVTETEKIHS